LKCHICAKEALSFKDTKTDILYYYCKGCEYIFKSPEHHHDLAIQKKRYDLHQNDKNHPGYRAYYQYFLDFVMPLASHVVSDALDFGCGASALLSEMMTETGISCDYYDPIYHPNLPDENKKYDLIVSTEVFEHLHQPKAVFEKLLNRLNADGILAIQTQFHNNNSEDFLQWYYRRDATHIVFFTPKTFKVLCDRFGCQLLAHNGKNIAVIRKL